MRERLPSIAVSFVLGCFAWHVGFSGAARDDTEPLPPKEAEVAADAPGPCLCPRSPTIQTVLTEPDPPLLTPEDRAPSREEDVLLAALGVQSSPAARRQVLRGLARVGSSRSIPLIAEIGSSGAPLERLAAIRALGAIGGPDAESVLVGLTEGGTLDDRVAAIEALGDTGAAEAREWLVEMASRGDGTEAPAAMMALADIGGPQVERELVGILQAGQLRDAVAAAKALARTGTSTARRALIAAARAGTTGVRAAAVRGLAAFGDETSRGVVVAAATSGDPSMVSAGIEGLGDMGDPDAVRVLRSILLGGSTTPAMEAASALGQIGSDGAVSALADGLAVASSNIAWTVTSALASAGGDAARAALLHACSGSSQRALAALDSIAMLPPGEDTIEVLHAVARSQNPNSAGTAMTALVSHIGEAALPMLQDMLPGASRSMKVSLLTAIAQVGTPEAAELVMASARDGSPEVKSSAMALAANMDGPVRDELRAMLIEQLRATDGLGNDLYQAPYLLARIGGAEATQALIESARAQESWQIGPVIGALVSTGDPAAMHAVAGLVRDETDPERKLAYLQSLGSAESPEVQELMHALVRGEDVDLATAALDNLSWADPAAASTAALELFESGDAQARARAMGVLARTQGEGALDAAARALHDEDLSVRTEALSALDSIGTGPARELLRGAWRDGDEETREAAVWSMAQNASPEDIDLLLREVDGADGLSSSIVAALASNPSPTVRARLLALSAASSAEGSLIHEQLGEAGLIDGWVPPEDASQEEQLDVRHNDPYDLLIIDPE